MAAWWFYFNFFIYVFYFLFVCDLSILFKNNVFVFLFKPQALQVNSYTRMASGPNTDGN